MDFWAWVVAVVSWPFAVYLTGLFWAAGTTAGELWRVESINARLGGKGREGDGTGT